MPSQQRPARIGFLLSQLGVLAAELFAAQTRELGITPSEAGVIRIIGRSSGISQRDLAGKLGIVQSRVVVLIDRLESAGFAKRVRSESDRRTQQLELTEAGQVVLRKLRTAAEAQETAITAGMDPDQRRQLFELLSTLSVLRSLDSEVHRGNRPADRENLSKF
jgi:DNA-binding MarR family transcriptional regulator